jgi:hypothetical protein
VTLRALARTLATAGVLVMLLLLPTAASQTKAQYPAPSPGPGLVGTGDPRSSGEGPGLVGSPLGIAVGVVLLGMVAAGGTAVYLRLTRDD